MKLERSKLGLILPVAALLTACPSDDGAGDEGADSGNPTTSGDPDTGSGSGSDSGSGSGSATGSGSGSDSGSGSGSGGALCSELDCSKAGCLDRSENDCLPLSICLEAATADCVTCMQENCVEILGSCDDETLCLNKAYTIGNCEDGDGDLVAECMINECNEICDTPNLRGCLCV